MKKKANGFTLVELLVVIAILGILMGALFPAVSGALLSAKMTACQADGKDIIQGIVRASAGDESYWPKKGGAQNQNAADDDLVQKGGYSTTYDYFNALFDMDNVGKEQWEPYVDKGLLSKVSGQGIKPPQGGEKLKAENCKWIIAANTEGSDVPGTMPVLVTRNVSVSEVGVTTYNGTDKTRMKLGKKKGGDNDEPFGGEGLILVRKDGGAEKLQGRECTLFKFFKTGFTLSSDGDTKFEFLPNQSQ